MSISLILNINVIVTLLLLWYLKANDRQSNYFVHFLADDLNISSYSGYLNVNDTHNSSMFFWFFPHPNGSAVPLLLWSNGGPATSALEGLFLENGPLLVTENITLVRRKYSWTNEYSVLYIDTPIGTGFSYTNSENGYSTNTEEIGKTLFSALVQFFEVFEEFQKADFYATAQSYGTKYMVSLSNRIVGSHLPIKQNFQGSILLVPFLCPITHFDPKFHHQMGLIDQRQLDKLEIIAKEMRMALKQGRMRDATALLTHTLLGALPESETILTKYTGFADLSNIMYEMEASEFERHTIFLSDARVRRHLHVDANAIYHLSSARARNALQDIPKCELPALESLLNTGRRVFIVCGNLDAYVPSATWDRILDALRWQHSTVWRHTERRSLIMDFDRSSDGAAVRGHVAGYLKCAANLCFSVLRNAGHLVPTDQPRSLLKMMTAFTSGNITRGTL